MVLYFMFQMLTQAPMLILSFNMPKSQCSGCCKMYMTADFVAFDSEITKLVMCQDSKSISAVRMLRWVLGFIGLGYTKSVVTLKLLHHLTLILAQAGNICVAAFDSTCSGICKSTDPIVEVNMQCVDLEIII
ncbi:hypothetical protein YC2023_077053 [Brassica napus]